MLRRNAMLRALVKEGVTVDTADVHTAYVVRYGPKVRARVIVVPTQRQAAELRAKLEPGSAESPRPSLAMAFADAAARYSTDPSAARGGSLPPLSLDDPAYPAAAREALRPLKPGGVTQPFAAPDGFAFFLLEGLVDEPSPPPEAEVADALRREVTQVRERLAMDELARRTLESAPLRVHDRGLAGARGQ
jgi:parvulin-like peptidyl-prolyl isomerase